jgi:hypothetical protein
MGRRNSNALAPHGFTKIPPTCSDILMKSVLVVDPVILSIRTKAMAGNFEITTRYTCVITTLDLAPFQGASSRGGDSRG